MTMQEIENVANSDNHNVGLHPLPLVFRQELHNDNENVDFDA